MQNRRALCSLGYLWILVLSLGSLQTPPTSLAEGETSRTSYEIRLPMIVNNYTPGTVTGRVIDASTRQNLENVSVCTNPLNCAITDAGGTYTLSSDSGTHLVTASADDYYIVIQQAKFVGNQAVTLNFALSSIYSSANIELRIVLTWSANEVWCESGLPPCENDLDAHLWLAALTPYHIYNEYQGDCTFAPNACLEFDTRKGFGPETIAIRQLESSSVYYYGVRNYNQGQPDVPPITETGAHLEIYNRNGPIASYDVPQTGDGNFWYAFNYSQSSETGDWVIEPVNCITLYNEVITQTINQCP